MVTYAEEKFTDVQPEIAALAPIHWDYVANEGPSLDINWPLFYNFEELDILKVLTVRDESTLVGYIIFILNNALHYQTILQAHDDAFFLKAEYRKGTTGIKMFVEAEKMLRKYGVYRVIYHEKTKVPMGKVFKYLGYEPREVLWMKEI